MLLNYLDQLIQAGVKIAPEPTKEVTNTLPPLIRKNIEIAFGCLSCTSFISQNRELQLFPLSIGGAHHKPKFYF